MVHLTNGSKQSSVSGSDFKHNITSDSASFLPKISFLDIDFQSHTLNTYQRMVSQIGKELGGGHQGAVYELLDGKGKDSGQVLKVISIAEPCRHTTQ